MPRTALPLLAAFLLPTYAFAAEPTMQPLLRLETGMHTAKISQIATDASGRWAVTASEDKTARVWEIASRHQVTVLRPPQDAGNEGKLYAAAISPDGNVVVVAGWTGADWGQGNSIYFFDRATGHMVRPPLAGLPNVINYVAFSPDGRWLAAVLGGNSGLRVFDALRGTETARDADYGASSYRLDFSPDGRRLLTTSRDGKLRVYPLTEGRLGEPSRSQLAGGEQPLGARFSPDGNRIAVSFFDSAAVQVLDARSLTQVAWPNTSGVDNGNLGTVAWTANGRCLVATGTWLAAGMNTMRRWNTSDWNVFHDLALSSNTIVDVAALPDDRLLFASADPAWGVVDAAGKLQYHRDALIADLRGAAQLGASADGLRVSFGYRLHDLTKATFDLAARRFGDAASDLSPARTEAPGLKVRNWWQETPTLNDKRIRLKSEDSSRSLAIGPDADRFVLGMQWSLRLFDREGHELWSRRTPGVAWAVNVTGDGRFVLAAYGDGTIRWHRLSDGEELLAFFPHPDRHRWIAWTPEGFYATSGPDADELIGYHVNRGRGDEGDFISASQLREQFYQPGIISRRLDTDGDSLVADAVRNVGDVRELLVRQEAQPPVIELLSEGDVNTDYEITVKVRVPDGGELIYRIDGVEIEGRMVAGPADGTESRRFALPAGDHKITVSARNARGAESQPVTVTARVRSGSVAPPSLYVLAVGVSLYQDPALRRGVRLAAADARAIGQLLRQQGSRFYKSPPVVKMLTDEEGTGAAVRAALDELAGRIAPQDVFVLFLAGHGFTFESMYHFAPQDAVYTSGEAFRKKSINEADLRQRLARIVATKSLVLLDTCSAGGFGSVAGRGIDDKGAMDRFNRLSGRATIGATADEMIALENEGHGAFTFTLLEGLRGKADLDGDGFVEVSELADFVEDELPRITNKAQYPFREATGNFPLVPKP